MTTAKKNYASLIEVQEGNLVPKDAQLAITGIEALAKSTKSVKTRNALKKILLEDIMRADQIDQMRVIKDIAVLEKQIINSLQSGSKEYYKPATIKSMGSYDDPMRIQGIKASYAWNLIRGKDLPAIDLDARNGIDIAKVIINRATVEKIKDTYPDIYANILEALDNDAFKTVNKKTGKVTSNSIDAIAIPMDVNVPDWLMEFIDYDTLVNDNIGGFPYQSIGIVSRKGINYTNIIEL